MKNQKVNSGRKLVNTAQKFCRSRESAVQQVWLKEIIATYKGGTGIMVHLRVLIIKIFVKSIFIYKICLINNLSSNDKKKPIFFKKT